jgi:WhiB family redox-sensing transcriptional regulator
VTTTLYGAAVGSARIPEAGAPSDWRSAAACRAPGVDPELFFASSTARAAKRVCARCPVRESCLKWALETRQDCGVLGGLSADERRGLHRRWKRPPGGGRYVTRAGQIAADPATYRKLVASQKTPAQIAAYFDTNVATINQVQRMLDAAPAGPESAGAK